MKARNCSNSISRVLYALFILIAFACSSVTGAPGNPDRRTRRYYGMSAGQRPRIKRMYALCPPQFQRIGNECYFLSSEKVNWLDAQFQCLDRDSKLAEPNKVDDRRLRKYLLATMPSEKIAELWLGGKYDEQHKNWLWGYNGRRMKYQAFGKEKDRDADLQHHCTAMSRAIKYRWSATPCMEDHYFVCQHRMPVVKKNNLQHIYNMWNSTFPNQIANEIEVLFINQDNAGGGDLRQRFQVDSKANYQRQHGRPWRQYPRRDGGLLERTRSQNGNTPEANRLMRPGGFRKLPNEGRRLRARHPKKVVKEEERFKMEGKSRFIE